MGFTRLKDKMGLIFWPYLRLSLLFLLAWGIVDGALITWLPAFEPREEIWGFAMPLALAAAVVVTILWPRLRLLRDNNKRNDPRFIMALLATCVIGISTSFLHDYLAATLPQLMMLDSPRQLEAGYPLARYYQFRHFYQTPHYIGVLSEFGGDHKGRTPYLCYMAAPVLAATTDTLRPARVWRVQFYFESVSSNSSSNWLLTFREAFLQRSQRAFTNEIAELPHHYFERLNNTSQRESFIKAVRRSSLCPPDTTQPLLLLTSAKVAFAERGQGAALGIVLLLGCGAVLFFCLLLIPPLLSVPAQHFRAGRTPRVIGLDWLRPGPGFRLTPLLLIGNVLLYLAMALSTSSGVAFFTSTDLWNWGALTTSAGAPGLWWRLFSSFFLYDSLAQLAIAMLLLWLVGRMLEGPLGSRRFALLYLVAALGATLANAIWCPAELSIGASGAIFGLLGGALMLTWRRALPLVLHGDRLALAIVFSWLGLLLGFFLQGSGVAAHLGGLATGAVLGLLLSPGLRRRLPYYEATTPLEADDRKRMTK